MASSDTTCVILWHTQLDKKRQDLCGSLLIHQAETIVCFCCVYGCVMQTTADDTGDSLPSPSLNLDLALLFSCIQCILADTHPYWLIPKSKPVSPFASWIHMHVTLGRTDSRGQEKMDWLPKGKQRCRKLSVTLYLIIFALMTPLVQESIQPDWLQGHRVHYRKRISPNYPLWMRRV